jgi:hypothetical protein
VVGRHIATHLVVARVTLLLVPAFVGLVRGRVGQEIAELRGAPTSLALGSILRIPILGITVVR